MTTSESAGVDGPSSGDAEYEHDPWGRTGENGHSFSVRRPGFTADRATLTRERAPTSKLLETPVSEGHR